MTCNAYYICQTLVEDERMSKDIFNARIIKPLLFISKEVNNLKICLHPRSNKNYYSELLNKSNVSEDKFDLSYYELDDLFIGHYSTIIFKLIINSNRVLTIDIDWDELPKFISNSSSRNISWDEIKSLKKTLKNSKFKKSQPTKDLKSMFEEPKVFKEKALISSIFN